MKVDMLPKPIIWTQTFWQKTVRLHTPWMISYSTLYPLYSALKSSVRLMWGHCDWLPSTHHVTTKLTHMHTHRWTSSRLAYLCQREPSKKGLKTHWRCISCTRGKLLLESLPSLTLNWQSSLPSSQAHPICKERERDGAHRRERKVSQGDWEREREGGREERMRQKRVKEEERDCFDNADCHKRAAFLVIQ